MLYVNGTSNNGKVKELVKTDSEELKIYLKNVLNKLMK